jgi:phage baseplate assembly protein W
MPSLDTQWFGYNPPFFGGQQGVLSRQSGLRLIKNDLQQLIMTLPGERVMRPTFGTPLRGILFDSVSQEQLILVADAILEAINKIDTRVNARVSFEVDEDAHVVRYKVVAQVKDGETDIEEFILLLEI